jgi:hypothetical protein
MTQGEGTAATWISTAVGVLTLNVNPILSALASLLAIVLSGFLIYKAILDIQHRKELLKNSKK